MLFNLLFSLPYNRTGIVVLLANTEQKPFSPFGDRQACKTPVVGEITNPCLNTSPFQRKFNMSLCNAKENLSYSFAISQKLGILLTAGT